jgi:hypothetical protein
MKSKLGQSVASLSAEQRVSYYRAAAIDVMKLCNVIKEPVLRSQYVQLASGWYDLAHELENSLHVPGETADADHKATN